jgi:hypothetical protein
MIHRDRLFPTIENPEHLLARSAELHRQWHELQKAAYRVFEKQLGLEAGVTRVREGDLEGYFLESKNYIDGRLYNRVLLDPPLPGRPSPTSRSRS